MYWVGHATVWQILVERIPKTRKDNVKLNFGELDGKVAGRLSGSWRTPGLCHQTVCPLSMLHNYSACVLQVAAHKDDDDDDDQLPSGGMVLDLTAELGTPPLSDTNSTSVSCHPEGQLPQQECHWANTLSLLAAHQSSIIFSSLYNIRCIHFISVGWQLGKHTTNLHVRDTHLLLLS